MKRILLTLRLRIQLVGEFGLAAVRGVRIIKTEERSIVLSGWLNKEQVVFKKYLSPNAADIAKRAASEVQYLEENLKDPFFVNQCIATAPAIGVIVFRWAHGQSVRLALKKATASGRKEILQLAGGWLGSCVDLRSQVRPVRADKFVSQLQGLNMQSLRVRTH